jgi:hypothetical protein
MLFSRLDRVVHPSALPPLLCLSPQVPLLAAQSHPTGPHSVVWAADSVF